MSDSAAPTLRHMPQLDALRAFAVAAVVAHHFELFSGAGDLALLGVELFFVLSGFLITGILLRARAEIDAGTSTRPAAWKRFYARRSRRIFPVYFLIVGLGLVLDLHPAREAWPWLVTYTLNVYIARLGYFVSHFAHFWTLAVEEQFYLVWPWIVLLIPRRWLPVTVGAAVAAGLVCRYAVWFYATGDLDTYVLTPNYLDFLGVGALLAIAPAVLGSQAALRRRMSVAVLPAAAAGYVALDFLHHRLPNGVHSAAQPLCVALLFGWLVAMASEGFPGVIGRALEWSPLVYVGQISYGIYAYHPFVPELTRWLFGTTRLPLPRTHAGAALVYVTLTLAISALSWRLMERPIRNLGRSRGARLDEPPRPAIVASVDAVAT